MQLLWSGGNTVNHILFLYSSNNNITLKMAGIPADTCW